MKVNDRFFTAPDGTRIAYGVSGTGPALVLANGLMATGSFWARLWPVWVEQHTVVTWDYPGHGESGPVRSEGMATIEAQPRILASILDKLGIEHAALVGFSVGCQVILEMYRQFPARVSALVALLGTAEHAISSTDMALPAPVLSRLFHQTPPGLFALGYRMLAEFADTEVGLALGRRLALVGSASSGDMEAVIDHFKNLHAPSMQRMGCSAEAHSAFDLLGQLRVPFLIVAGDKDVFAPADPVSVRMHAAARGSELVRLSDATHTGLLDHAPQILEAVERFLAVRASVAA